MIHQEQVAKYYILIIIFHILDLKVFPVKDTKLKFSAFKSLITFDSSYSSVLEFIVPAHTLIFLNLIPDHS